jgi:aminomethyltransferase
MLKTPLYDHHVALSGRIVDFAGWAMPVQYSTITDEHRAVRTAAGLFDISHMGRLRVSGSGAVALVERLVTCRVAGMKDGQVRYGLVTNEAGGILDDVLVYRTEGTDVALVVNASNREKIVAWIDRHRGDCDAGLLDETFDTAMLAVQGPSAAGLLAPHLDSDPASLGYYRYAAGKAFGVPAAVSRTGYTGEDGFELIVPAAEAAAVWDKLVDAGRPHGLLPCGLGCRDTLRLEAAMPLYGHELSEEIDPVTAGLGFAVALDKGFIGRDAVAAVKERGPQRVRIGLRLAGKRIAREGTPVLSGNETVGAVTSGTFSPTLQASIAMAYVPPGLAAAGTALAVDLRGKQEPAEVVPLPFYKRTRS